MVQRDLESKATVVSAFQSATINSDTTTNGVKIDTVGFESIMFVAQIGVVSNGDVTPLIEDSPDNSIFTAVIDDFLVRKGIDSADGGQEADAILDTSHDVESIGYVGKERYVRFSYVSDNSANIAGCSATAVKTLKRHTGAIT